MQWRSLWTNFKWKLSYLDKLFRCESANRHFVPKMCQKHCTCLTCLHHSHFLSFQTNLFRFLHRGGAGRGRASLLRQVISVFHQNLSQLHISVVGGGVSSPIIRTVIQHLDIWSHWWRFDFWDRGRESSKYVKIKNILLICFILSEQSEKCKFILVYWS